MVDAQTRPRPDTEAALSHLDQLPTLPGVVLQILQATSDRNAGAQDLIKLLNADQSLTARVLSVASSPALAARPVRTLEQAVPLIGFATVRNIVLSTSVFDAFKQPAEEQRENGFDRQAFWLHALAVACAARELAQRQPQAGVDPENAYIAGLLHDLGKVALSAVFPKAYDRIVSATVEARGDISEFERDALGVDHARAGRRLAEQWRLPEEFNEVIWLHHFAYHTLPDSVRNPQLIGIVQLADIIAREQRIGFSGNYQFLTTAHDLAGQLGIKPTQLEEAAASLVSETTELASLLGLDRDPPEKVFVRAMGQANAELGRINTQLAATNRRLESAARFFTAMSEFDRQIGSWADLTTVVEKLLPAAKGAMQRGSLAVLGIGEQARSVVAAWQHANQADGTAVIDEVPADFRDWAQTAGVGSATNIIRTPTVVRHLLANTPALRGSGAEWFAPICQNETAVGGILFLAQPNEECDPPADSTDLRALLNGFGLAITRANAQSAARRLTEDLAEANHRLQKMQSEVLQSRTISMIAEMASGAGHELNSPLTVIAGRAEMLSQDTRDPETIRALDAIRDQAHECSKIVSELMEFAKPRPLKLTEFDLLALVRATAAQLQDHARFQHITLNVQCDGRDGVRPLGTNEPTFPITADRDMLHRVLVELVTNAAAHPHSERPLRIEIALSTTMGGRAYDIRVNDNGAGMTPEVAKRAFDPFFSFRPAGRGRGLGLPQVHRTIEAHGGKIWLDSKKNEGTTVRLQLPRETDSRAIAGATLAPL